MEQIQEMAWSVAAGLQQRVAVFIHSLDFFLYGHTASLRPWQIAIVAFTASWLLLRILSSSRHQAQLLRDKGCMQTMFIVATSLPFIRGYAARQQATLVEKMKADMKQTYAKDDQPLLTMPAIGRPATELKAALEHKKRGDVQFANGNSKASGTVYFAPDAELRQLLDDTYAAFAVTNPLHADVFPSVRRMEAEVVSMVGGFLGGGGGGDADCSQVCGAMTSGGTESILSAVKASRDYMAQRRGITHPEMVIGESAHAAFFKAAEYFKIRLIKVQVDKDFRLTGAAVKRAMSRNTVLVVASSPGFPHGVVDHVTDIAREAQSAGVPCHSDACLGGFVLPFARKLGFNVPAFDFSVPGVTSMSVDTHKFGMAHKGTSVVLYRWPSLRQHQYTAITDWTGGLYISPGFAGSRSGALISTAWAALVHLGEAGYIEHTRLIMKAAKRFEGAIRNEIPELRVCGQPHMCNIAFYSAARGGVNVYAVNDRMSKRGWHLNALQRPAAVHMCFTAQHVNIVDELIKDLKECVTEVKCKPELAKGGNAPMYGMAATLPDRSIVGNFLVAFQNAQLEL